MRKLNGPAIFGVAIGLLVLTAWLVLFTELGARPHGLHAFRWLAFVILASSFLAGFFVYEYFEKRRPRPFSLADDLPMKTGTKLGAPNDSIRCPSCDAPMVKRLAKRGRIKGHIFFGCSNFPQCRATRSMEDAIWRS